MNAHIGLSMGTGAGKSRMAHILMEMTMTPDDEATIEQLRRELRGEVPLGTTPSETHLVLAAIGREIVELHKLIRERPLP